MSRKLLLFAVFFTVAAIVSCSDTKTDNDHGSTDMSDQVLTESDDDSTDMPDTDYDSPLADDDPTDHDESTESSDDLPDDLSDEALAESEDTESEDTESDDDTESDHDSPITDDDEVDDTDLPPIPQGYCRHAFCVPPPVTGQKNCYNNSASIACPTQGEDFYGTDAQYFGTKTRSWSCITPPSNIPSNCPFEVTDGEIVIDNHTGLYWQRKFPQSYTEICLSITGCTFEEAMSYCENLVYGGYSDWRLPGLAEYVMIFNYNSFPAVDISIFPSIKKEYWSSSEHTNPTYVTYGRVAVFGDDDGAGYTLNAEAKTKLKNAMCVRGDIEPPTHPYLRYEEKVFDDDKVLIDHTAELMWGDIGGTIFKTNLKNCEDSTFAGFSDWRAATVIELFSRVDHLDFANFYPPRGLSSTTSPQSKKNWVSTVSTASYKADLQILKTQKTLTSFFGRCVRSIK